MRRPGEPVARRRGCVLESRRQPDLRGGVASLTDDAVRVVDASRASRRNFTVDEYHDVDEAMRAHPDVVAALAERGITDMSLVLIEVWTYGKALMPEQ